MATHLRMLVPPAPWTRALEDGSVAMPDVSWECASHIEMAPDRFLASGGYDVGENGVRRVLLDLLRGAAPTAIPVFFGREHMQRNIVVRADGDLHHPRDLVGKRVGSRLSVQSGTGAGVLMMLELGYGLDLRAIEWHMGDPADLPENRMDLPLCPGPPSDEEAFERLGRGDLDALVFTAGPRYWSLFGGEKLDQEVGQHPGLRLLLSEPAMIADVYRRTGLYPITDVATVRPGLAEEYPGLPSKLVQIFAEANALAARYRPPEEQRLADEEVRLLGEDPHQYGLGANQRANLAAFIDLLYRLGAIRQPIDPEAMFVEGR